MNIVILIGNLTRDSETAQSENGTIILKNTIAVSRGKDKKTDFINFVAFNKTAELIGNYFIKGDRIGLKGRWQVRTYETKDKEKRTANELIVEEIEFLQNRPKEDKATPPTKEEPESRYTSQYNLDDEDLPF